MRRAPLILIVALLAGLVWFLWPAGPAAGDGGTGSDGAGSGAAAAPAAGVLSANDPPEVRREAASGSMVIRVLDAQGKASSATVHGKINGAAVRLSARDGLLTVPPPLESCELMAESGTAWSPLERWTAASGAVKEVVLRLEPEIGATLRIRVTVEGEGPASAPVARLTSPGRRGGIGEVFEGFEFRQDLRDRAEDEERREAEGAAAAPPPPAPPEAGEAARARLLRENFAAESWSGQDGLIEIGSLLPGAWSFEITQPGCAPEFLDLQLLPLPTERELQLRRAGSLTGRVLGPDGRALAGAELALWTKLESEMPWFDPLDDFERYGRIPGAIPAHHRATSGEDGRFTLPLVRPGSFQLLAVAEGLRPAVGGALEVLSQQRTDAGDVSLRRGHSLQIRAVDGAGQPVAEARASWRAGETTMAALAAGAKPALTDADGRVLMTALPGGELEAEVVAPGFARAREKFVFEDPPRAPQNWDVVLRAGAVLTGTVSSAGLPVGEATVQVTGSEGQMPMLQQLTSVEARARSLPDGSFRIESLPVGSWRVRVEHPDHAAFTSDELNLIEGENPPLIVELAPGASLRVTVLDETGAPVPQATIVAMETSMQTQEAGTTGPDGVTLFGHLRAGNWQVMRVDAFTQNQGAVPADFEVRFEYVQLADGEFKELTLGGRKETATIEGRLTVGGAPQDGRMVLLIGPGGMKSGTSNADGEFKLEKVEVGDYVVTVVKGLGGGGSSWTGSLTVAGGGVQRHDLALPSSAVEILVRDGASGEIVKGIPVNLRPEDGSSISGGMFMNTDDQGVARFDMLRPDVYLASVGSLAMPMLGGGEGLSSGMVGGIRVASEDSGTQRVEVRLPQPARLRLRVSGPDGSYLAGAHVFYVDENGNPLNVMSMKPTNSRGVIEVSGLPPGLGRFVVRHPQIGTAEFEMMLQAGELSKHEITLGEGVHVLLSIVNGNGEPIGGVLAVLTDARGRAVNTLYTIEETQALQQAWYSGGALRVGPLTPGPFTVRLVRPGQPTITHAITVAAEPAEQPLRLRYAPD